MSRAMNPITLELVQNALLSICDEMSTAIVRSSRSRNITERRDCSCSLYTAGGEMLVQAQHQPIHLGVMPHAVRGIIAEFAPSNMSSGEVFIVNDPYHGANHLPDLIVAGPMFLGNELVGFAATMAHHNDVGGVVPRSMPADATEIFQEGLRLPPIRFAEEGRAIDDIVKLIAANSRKPEERVADLEAQLATVTLAQRRITELADPTSTSSLLASTSELLTAQSELLDRSERAMKARLATIADGTGAATIHVSTGLTDPEIVKIAVRVTKQGQRLNIDFDGSGPQTASPFNSIFANTYAAVLTALRMTIADGLPASEGLYRAVTVNAPVGTIVNAQYPSAVSAATQVSWHTFDAVVAAIQGLNPELGLAESGSVGVFSFGGFDSATNTPFAFGGAVPGGLGASADTDGQSAVPPPASNSQNTPVEVREAELPIRVLEYSLLEHPRGEGLHRGGKGVREVIEFLGPATCSLQMSMGLRAPQGRRGGTAAGTSVVYWTHKDQTETFCHSTSWRVAAGDQVTLVSPGGGGWGETRRESGDLS